MYDKTSRVVFGDFACPVSPKRAKARPRPQTFRLCVIIARVFFPAFLGFFWHAIGANCTHIAHDFNFHRLRNNWYVFAATAAGHHVGSLSSQTLRVNPLSCRLSDQRHLSTIDEHRAYAGDRHVLPLLLARCNLDNFREKTKTIGEFRMASPSTFLDYKTH